MKALPEEVERDLIRRGQAGDLTARDALFDQFYPLMWRFALRARTRQVEAAELVQHCYLAFERALKLFDLKRVPRVRFMSYLYTAMAHAISHKDARNSLVRIPEGVRLEVFSLDSAADGDRTILSRLACPSAAKDVHWREHRDQWRLVRKAINGLAPREKRIIKLRLRSMTLTGIGEMLGVTKERVRQLEQRALKRIRETLNVKAPQ